MVNKIFLFVGVILIVVGIIVYLSVNGVSAAPSGIQLITTLCFTGIPGGLGVIFFLVGLVGTFTENKRNKQMLFIAKTGADAEGTVTFVDRNFQILINKQPIYSIVEYKFKDMNGMEHTRRIDTVNSEWVIRNKIEVGSKLKIKYLTNDPAQNVLMF